MALYVVEDFVPNSIFFSRYLIYRVAQGDGQEQERIIWSHPPEKSPPKGMYI